MDNTRTWSFEDHKELGRFLVELTLDHWDTISISGLTVTVTTNISMRDAAWLAAH